MPTPNLSSLISHLNDINKHSLEKASQSCHRHQHSTVDIEHWLIELMQAESDIKDLLSSQAINVREFINALRKEIEKKAQSTTSTPTLSIKVIELIKEAWCIATLEQSQQVVRTYHVLIALMKSAQATQLIRLIFPQIDQLNLDTVNLHAQQTIDFNIEEGSHDRSIQQAPSTPSALAQYTVNLNELAQQGKIDQAIGRESEIRQIMDILMRRRQNNPILTGEPGVGKTAVVEGLALKIIQKQVPATLLNVHIHSLDMGLLMAGAGIKGEFENRLKSVIAEISASPHPVILFIDEAHTIIGAGNQTGGMDTANLLKPALARGQLRTIAATTWSEYKQYFEKDAALTRRFQVVKINEPDDATAISMCRSLRESLETHHRVTISDEAIITAVQLGRRYISDRYLPDKAISLLDTACAKVSLSQQVKPSELLQLEEEKSLCDNALKSMTDYDDGLKGKNNKKQIVKRLRDIDKSIINITQQWQKQISLFGEFSSELKKTASNKRKLIQLRKKIEASDNSLCSSYVNSGVIKNGIANWTGIPIENMSQNRLRQLTNMEQYFNKIIKGQSETIRLVCNKLKQNFAKLNDPNKPLGVFLFSGPSGVGKTLMAESIAVHLFGSKEHMTTINLSEFKEEHKVSMLLGAPAGYVGYGEGGILTEAVRRQPYHLVLLDEVEKAHHGIHEIFYQIFDKGFAQDGQGRRIDFKNTLFILTSNIGSDSIINHKDLQANQLIKTITPDLMQHFKSAFLGRLDVIPFIPINDDIANDIIKQKLGIISERIKKEHAKKIEFNEDTVSEVRQYSDFDQTGAREFDRVIRERVLPAVANKLLA